jgi:hypothetical protein
MICTSHRELCGYKIEKNVMGGHVARMGEGRGVYRILVGKPERKRPLGRPSCRCGDNMKMGLQEVGCGVWSGLRWLTLGTGRGNM